MHADHTMPRALPDHAPPGATSFGLKIFLLSLTMLFGGSIAAFLLIRSIANQRGLAYGSLHLPGSLWISTVLIILSSVTIQVGLSAVRRGRQSRFRTMILGTVLLTTGFLAVQAPSLARLLAIHEAARAQNVYLYGLVLLLIALHAAHVIGGLIPLGFVTVGALRGRYSAASHEPVTNCTIYWHFLDVVWLILFGVLWFTG